MSSIGDLALMLTAALSSLSLALLVEWGMLAAIVKVLAPASQQPRTRSKPNDASFPV